MDTRSKDGKRRGGVRHLMATIAVGVALLGASPALAQVSISVNPTLPGDIPGGASTASLQQAAAFAWQEFIALNWPAQSGQRDQANASLPFGTQTGPLVWETLRGKVEIFPGNGNSNVGPPGYTPTGGPSYGYNTPPTYTYAVPVPPCPGQTAPGQPAWINLDETTQIGLDRMFSGASPLVAAQNSQPQLIRFLAKANHVEYAYVAANQFWYNGSTSPVYTASQNFVTSIRQSPPVFPSGPSVNFPAGTVEVKAGWRKLGPTEDPTRYHSQTVRFYENKTAKHTVCYFEDTWALVALHIIQKTPSAPSFIYATFEQADNIVLPNGQPIEDTNGNVVNAPSAATPTTPDLTYTDSPTSPVVAVNPTGAPFCPPPSPSVPNHRLFYLETQAPGLPSGGRICVNSRDNPIASDIIQVNMAAHSAIQSYSASNGIKKSPWQFYKLVSVQQQPFDISKIAPTPSTMAPAVFFQANIAVETDFTLQQFRGRIFGGSGPPTSYPSGGFAPPPNVYSAVQPAPQAQGVNMGGCMGCHGNAQVAGFDFSFILKGGPDREPETPSATSVAVAHLRYLDLLKSH